MNDQERIEWAGKIRDYKVDNDSRFGLETPERLYELERLKALEGEELLELFPDVKWFPSWNKCRLTWETVLANCSVLTGDSLLGKSILEVLRIEPAVIRFEDDTFGLIGGRHAEVSEDSLVKWGIISQEQFIEIKRERQAAYDDEWTRSDLGHEASGRRAQLNEQRKALMKELEGYEKQLRDIDTMPMAEIDRVRTNIKNVKTQIEELDRLISHEDALIKSYREGVPVRQAA